MKWDAIIIGAGAAGLLCAIEAGRRGRSVLILEHGDRPGRKVAISGGGRCNFTNRRAAAEHYRSANPSFCKSALAQFTPVDFIAMVERHAIRYHEKQDGQLFCDGKAVQIVDLLENECRQAGARLALGCRVRAVAHDRDFVVTTAREVFRAPALVVATGGLAMPSVGATGWGHELARQFGLRIIPPRPALVPLVGDRDHHQRFRELSGISLKVAVRCQDATFRGQMLFTHRGLSGPAILQISSCWEESTSLVIDLLPDASAEADFLDQRTSRSLLANVLNRYLPRRLAARWCEIQGSNLPARQYSKKQWAAMLHDLRHWQPSLDGTEGYEQAEVTRGGVDTRELSSRTMEAGSVPGLHFVGEVVDVTGQLGGYNLHWAWASGFAAGQAV